MALWSKPPLEQKAQISEDQNDQDELIVLDGEYIVSTEDEKMLKIYGSEIPFGVSKLFYGYTALILMEDYIHYATHGVGIFCKVFYSIVNDADKFSCGSVW
ncbi:hypothetical protein SAY86_006728 [Trapa natans]|uniref:Uncharacterized protein n=1 Tax=Trapa natans TaxID=22666 RepID=A0AAN7LCN6_TRANT|nr:hypothetical protein SAY86_006728 [Trapa natans]